MAKDKNYQKRCDLLKIHYLCGRNDNLGDDLYFIRDVVICSKFITFVVEMTTRDNHILITETL